MPRYADIVAVRDALYEADAITMKGVRILNQFPTISPDEVRGVWEWTNKRTIEHDGDWWCTTCGKEIAIYMGKDRKDRYAFCPNCGAKMEVSEDA